MIVIKLGNAQAQRNERRAIGPSRWARCFVPAMLLAWATAAAAHEQHSGYSAGEPGNPNQPAREIIILMNEMDYSPAIIDVKRGEQVRFVIRNVGAEAHEFLLATTAENLRHEEVMKKHPGMEHDEPNGVRLPAKTSREMLWKFSKTGTFEYSCLIPAHREFGMVGKIVVK